MRLAIAQINPIVGDFPANEKKILEFALRAKKMQADCVVFPEMAICGYPPEDLLLKEHFVDENLAVLKRIAKKIKGLCAIIGFVDKGKNKSLYNAAAFISNGKLRGIYHKQALPNYGVFDEKRYFQKGFKNPRFVCGSIPFAVNICEDIWAETKASLNRNKHIKLLVNISCSPFDVGKLRKREQLLKKRAKQLGVYVCYVNLVGGQDELVFDGGSMIVSPDGKVRNRAKRFEEDCLIVDLPLKAGVKPEIKVEVKRRPENRIFSFLEQIYQALVLGTADYVKKNGFKKVLIGLSGGIDSALVAVLAVKAVGCQNVVCVSMPSKYSSAGTKKDARKLAKNLGVEFKEIPIEGIVSSYSKVLSGEFKGLKSGAAEENIQARVRGNILMALSNKFGWLVLTTGNKSEFAVGYCTLYGDMSGGFAVIKDLPKTKVYELSKHINQEGLAKIPQRIIDRAPSAELRFRQKDQDSLPEYHVLDGILDGYVEKHQSLAQLSKSVRKKALIKDVVNKVDKSEYKRRQAPPGIKITERAFGKDWRLPITNKYKII